MRTGVVFPLGVNAGGPATCWADLHLLSNVAHGAVGEGGECAIVWLADWVDMMNNSCPASPPLPLPVRLDVPVTPPECDLESIIRHVLAHRRITPVLLDAISTVCTPSGGWSVPVEGLLAGRSFLPEWDFSDAVVEYSGLSRYRLTRNGEMYVDPPYFFTPEFGRRSAVGDAQALVLVALWAAGSYGGTGSHYPKDFRREWLRCQFDERTAFAVVCTEAGLTVPDVCDAAGRLVAGAFPSRDWRAVDPGQIALAIDELVEAGLAESFAPRRPIEIWPALWERPQGTFSAAKRAAKSLRSLEQQALQLLELLAGRRSANRARSGQNSTTAQAAGEARNLAAVQTVIARIIRDHPEHIWATGTLWSISPFNVFAEKQRFEGNPTALPAFRPDGTAHPAVRRTQRIIDGTVWLSGDRPDQPSLLIEYEGAARNRLSLDHLLTALTLSAKWDKAVVLIFVVTTDAKKSVVDHCRSLLGLPDLRAQEIDFPNASVAVRVVSERAAAKRSALLCPPIWAADFVIRDSRGFHKVLTS